MHHAYFPESALALQEEVQNHPELVKRLYSAGVMESTLADKLAIIATYCDILLDGYYSLDDIIGICGALTNALRKKRVELILPISEITESKG